MAGFGDQGRFSGDRMLMVWEARKARGWVFPMDLPERNTFLKLVSTCIH